MRKIHKNTKMFPKKKQTQPENIDTAFSFVPLNSSDTIIVDVDIIPQLEGKYRRFIGLSYFWAFENRKKIAKGFNATFSVASMSLWSLFIFFLTSTYFELPLTVPFLPLFPLSRETHEKKNKLFQTKRKRCPVVIITVAERNCGNSVSAMIWFEYLVRCANFGPQLWLFRFASGHLPTHSMFVFFIIRGRT